MTDEGSGGCRTLQMRESTSQRRHVKLFYDETSASDCSYEINRDQ